MSVKTPKNCCNNYLTIIGSDQNLNSFFSKHISKTVDKIFPFSFDFSTVVRVDNLTKQEEHLWRVKNWGTGQNSYNCTVLRDTGLLYLNFLTVGTHPEPVIIELIRSNAQLDFEFIFAEWGMLFSGKIAGKDGVVIANEVIDNF